MLKKAGHELVGVLAGKVRHREFPSFFIDRIQAHIQHFGSPGFSIGKNDRSVRSMDTLIGNITRIPVFRRSLQTIDQTIRKLRPDLVLAFYEPLTGIYLAMHRPSVPFVALAHQYMFEHPAYRFPPGSRVGRSAVKLFTRLTGLGASWKLALSLYPAADRPNERLLIIPPLLREEALALAARKVPREDFLLIYLLNHGYAEQVIRWHERNPEQRLECFWDRQETKAPVRYDDTLCFNPLHDTRFLDLMARCKGLVCTAGFESISEAMFLAKPILAVPVEGHYEQRCNAWEIHSLGVGIRGETFDMDLLKAFIPRYVPRPEAFRSWVAEAEDRVLGVLEAAAAGHHPPTRATTTEQHPSIMPARPTAPTL